jgi:hypothetical protein
METINITEINVLWHMLKSLQKSQHYYFKILKGKVLGI